MTTIDTTTAATATGTNAASNTNIAINGLGENFDNFLLLLTTQMQNQDPLKPLDNNEMTQQLVAFAQVEQTIGTNSRLDQLLSMQTSNTIGSQLSYLGQRVEAAGDIVVLQNGKGEVVYELPASARSVRIDILDEAGEKIGEAAGPADEGIHRLAWDGTGWGGQQLPDGIYTVNIAVEEFNEDDLVVAETRTSGVVTGVDSEDGAAVLNLGEITIPLNSVLSVR